jgi:regulator of protease activity HflC (stomatin/prohibitin superfamily)
LQAAYGSADPVALLRASAGRVVAAFFAGQTLDRVLGENREEIADRLGVALQRDLDRSGAGIQVAAVVIEAIHPPAGAAEAYHNVQAAEIRANTSIEAERGRAKSTQANASQYATDVVAQAQAADHAAVSANSDAFLLERRLTAIGNGLAKSALTIVDHRIPPPEAPVLDLRPLSPTTARSAGTDRE